MAFIDLFGTSFFKEMEQDAIASVGVSLSRNNKIVTARTVKSVRAVTIFNSESVSIEVYGGEGLPYIMTDKPAGTKMPLDFKGIENGKKIFELKPRLKDWKAVIGFGGSDFVLARAIAKNPRPAVDIATEAIKYLSETISPKILKLFGKSLAAEISKDFDDAKR